MKKILLSVAGYDPSSGAGVLLDLKVFEQRGFQGMGILTAVTAQNTKLVKKVHCLSSELLFDQYKTLCQDVIFSGIKIGMIGSRENIKTIGKILKKSGDIPKVVDPVFRSSSGAWLLEKKAIPVYIAEIRKKASVITPNLEEAAMITGEKVRNLEEMKEAAKRIFHLTHIPCLIKGGHLKEVAKDVLFDGSKFHIFEKEKIKKNVHGTGCFLSSSILCSLAKGKSLEKACLLASQLTHQAIKKAIRIGHGQQIISFPL